MVRREEGEGGRGGGRHEENNNNIVTRGRKHMDRRNVKIITYPFDFERAL